MALILVGLFVFQNPDGPLLALGSGGVAGGILKKADQLDNESTTNNSSD